MATVARWRLAVLACTGALGLALPVLAADIVGIWKAVDDDSGQANALVRIVERRGVYSGTVIQVLDQSAPALCGSCPGERHNQPILGMTILAGMRHQGDGYAGGEILDPDSGTLYRLKARLTDGGARLELRGYVGLPLFGRTQVWERQPEAPLTRSPQRP
jgi:uncharacterized protein (DUF2147 family)